MAYRDIENQKEYARNWYLRNKEITVERARASTKRNRKRNLEYVNAIKVRLGCTDCGYNKNPVALDFDHVGTDKMMNICKLAAMAYSIEMIDKEIKKCEVVCANCHRIRTQNRIRMAKRQTQLLQKKQIESSSLSPDTSL